MLVHAPPQHAWPLVQLTPHAPQLVVVFSGVHAPLQHALPLPHTVPQAPQLLLSVAKVLHMPPQQLIAAGHAWPESQPVVHCWLMQICPNGQVVSSTHATHA
jgi:hypothetical protein